MAFEQLTVPFYHLISVDFWRHDKALHACRILTMLVTKPKQVVIMKS